MKIIFLCSAVLLTACQSLNSRFGVDSTNYSQAKELPALTLPAGTLAVSKRYDIPSIPATDQHVIIDNDMPPDYYTPSHLDSGAAPSRRAPEFTQ